MADRHSSRRSFLKTGGLLAGMSALPSPLRAAVESTADHPSTTRTYAYPNAGRIAIVHHPNAVLGFNNVDQQAVQYMFDQGIMQLAGIFTSPAAALASFFPGLSTTKRIAIKPNFLNSVVPTRKELMKAVLNRLTQMLGGFPASNITIYERHTFSSVGYTTSYFGHNVNLVYDASFPNLGYTILCDGQNRPYSASLHNADYLINMPVLKDHSCSSSLNLTLAFKNHMGTVNPGGSQGIHCNKNAILDIMASSVMTSKQKLVILDALYAVYNGGPGGNPQATPQKILLSQDPVAIDAQGRILINNLRTSNGLGSKNATYIDQAAAAPYSLGIADPAQMQVITVALPVDLVAFTATQEHGVVVLRWRTESESNNAGFVIERSVDGHTEWMDVGFVAGAGNSTQLREYRYEDSSAPLRERRSLFYRLRQVDHDGGTEHSSVVEVALQLDEAAWNMEQNYPNPFVHDTDIPLFLPRDTHVHLDLFDSAGRLVRNISSASMPSGMHYMHVAARDLPSGTYRARATAEGRVQEIQLIHTR